MMDLLPAQVEAIAKQVVDSAITVHRRLGPGLLESVYEQCFAFELTKRGLRVRRQVQVPITYDQLTIEIAFRMDLLVEELVIIETKAVKELHPVDFQQTLTHMKMASKPLGFLINFNESRVIDGLHRLINSQALEHPTVKELLCGPSRPS
jgi:GxxExxY protein